VWDSFKWKDCTWWLTKNSLSQNTKYNIKNLSIFVGTKLIFLNFIITVSKKKKKIKFSNRVEIRTMLIAYIFFVNIFPQFPGGNDKQTNCNTSLCMKAILRQRNLIKL